jgi:hypothetical protein
MSDKLKAHLFSAGITFISTFAATFATVIKLSASQGVEITLSGSFLVSIGIGAVIAAARAAGKALLEDLLKTDVLLGVKK